MKTKFIQNSILVWFLMTLFFCNKSYSQAEIGLKIGRNYANMGLAEGPLIGRTKINPAITAALTLSIPLSTDLLLQPEIGYTGRGFRSRFDFFGFNHSVHPLNFIATFNYLEFGSLILSQIGQKKTKLLIGAGPFLNYFVSGQSLIIGKLSGLNRDIVKEIERGKDANTIGWQLTGLLRMKQYLGKIALTIDLRLQIGLSNTIGSESDIPNLNPNIAIAAYHQSFGWRFGIDYPLGKFSR